MFSPRTKQPISAPCSKNSFFKTNSSALVTTNEQSKLIKEMEKTLDDSTLKRKFIISLLLNPAKLDEVLKVSNVTRYLTPEDVNKIAVHSQSSCECLIKAGIYKNNLTVWGKLEKFAEYHDTISHQHAPVR